MTKFRSGATPVTVSPEHDPSADEVERMLTNALARADARDKDDHGETAFSRQVADFARTCGWKVAHFRPARTNTGWRTAVAYDGAGWPDLHLVHPERRLVWYRELKTGRNKLSSIQTRWRDWLIAAGADYAIWRPDDWADIVAALSFGKGRLQ